MKKSLISIVAAELEMGMYLDSISGNWLDSPFWRRSFLITEETVLQQLRRLGQVECWVDTSRGIGKRQEEEGVPLIQGAVPSPEQPFGFDDAGLRRFAPIRRQAGESAAVIFRELRLGRAINSVECRALVLDIAEATSHDVDAALALLRLKEKDEYTHMHSVAVCALMINLAGQMGLNANERQQAGMVGLLHDIGKVAIPLEILNKPGGLTEQEFAVVRRHPEASAEMLAEASIGQEVRDGCLYHHEKIDGSGYPRRLTGSLIPLLARMCAICDVYDAITSNRPYKEGWDPAHSIAKMMAWKGHFDPVIVGHFVRSVGIYPAGSLVRLRSNTLAIVVRQNTANFTKPVVLVIFDAARERSMLQQLDLATESDSVVGIEERQAWPHLDVDGLWAPYVRASA